MTTGSHPAFAVFTSLGATVNVSGIGENTTSGLTKRELIASMAMQGLLSRGNMSLDNAAADAVKYTDMLIAELSA